MTQVGDEDKPQTTLQQGLHNPPRTGQSGAQEHNSFLKQKGYARCVPECPAHSRCSANAKRIENHLHHI